MDEALSRGGRAVTRRSVVLGALASAVAAAAGQVTARQQRPSFQGRTAGEERDVHAITLCWCPAGRFVMGSPRREPERRPGEDQVEVTLTIAAHAVQVIELR